MRPGLKIWLGPDITGPIEQAEPIGAKGLEIMAKILRGIGPWRTPEGYTATPIAIVYIVRHKTKKLRRKKEEKPC